MTTIYTSKKKLNKKALLKAIGNVACNIFYYDCVVKGSVLKGYEEKAKIEQGAKIEIIEELTDEEVVDLFNRIKKALTIGCVYIEHNSYNGCIYKASFTGLIKK